MSIRLLHISDLHLEINKYDQQIVLKAFEADLSRFSGAEKPDIVVFSGDLNQAGGTADDYQNFISAFEDKFLKPLGLGSDRLIVCPGNHDIDRELVRSESWVEEGLRKTLRTRDAINDFVDQFRNVDISQDEIPKPFSRLNGFYKGVWRNTSASDGTPTPFYFVQKRMIGDIKIGFCSFNTAWRCTGEADDADRANLVLGERAVDVAAEQISDCELKIAVFHHPTDWLVDEDRTAVEPRLHLEFDILMYGHVHQAMPQYRYGGAGGAVYAQGGCLYLNRKYFNGYSAIDIDLARSKVDFSVFEYSDRTRHFAEANGLFPPDGRVSFDIAQNEADEVATLNRLVALSRPNIRRLGNDHVSLAAQDAAKVDIERQFVCPPLKQLSHVPAYLDSDKSAEDKLTSVDEQLAGDSDILVLGGPEAGKTSIAHYCAIKTATGGGDCIRLPLIGNFGELRKGTNPLWRSVRSYANEVSDGSIDRTAAETLPTLVIIDDVDLANTEKLELLSEIRSNNTQARFILLAVESPGNGQVLRAQSDHLKDILCFEVKELPRNSIRLLSANWLNADLEGQNTDSTFEKVMEHIQRSGFPRSGYIVSLILWTLQNRSAGEILNEAVLLQNIIDHLLGRMDYSGALRKEFDFASKTAVLQNLSVWFKENEEIRSKNDVLNHIIGFFDQKGLSYDAASALDSFIDCGVLQQIDEDVSFRFGRFQEFFLAGQLRDEREKLENLIAGDDWLFYARELDIYTSRFRHESSLLDVAKDKMDAEADSHPSLSDNELEDYLAKADVPEFALKRLEKMRQEPMSAKRIDEMKDKAEQSLTRRRARTDVLQETEASRGPRIFRHLSALNLYGQFIRNLEFADGAVKRTHLRACLQSWLVTAKLTLEGAKAMFTELEQEIIKEEDVEEPEKLLDIVKNMESVAKNIIPTAFSTQIYQSLGSEKLSVMLNEIADDEGEEVLLRLLSIFTLLEIDPCRAISSFRSDKWEATLETRWVLYMVEARLFSYYQDRFLSGEVKRQFELIVGELHQRILGGSKRRKGLVMQDMAKHALASKTKGQNSK